MATGSVHSQRLPEYVRSLYRLLLRTTSASVLHRPSAVVNLRKMYRPDLEEAAKVLNKLQSTDVDLSGLERSRLTQWMEQWNTKMDNTLSLQYTAAVSRGLANKITANRLRLSKHYAEWMDKRLYKPHKQWRPDLSPSSSQYKPIATAPKDSARVATESVILTEHAWRPLDEVFKMAEGRDELSLGKTVYKKRRA